MAEFIEVANCAMFELRFTLFSQKIENTLYFEEALSWSAASLQDQCEALADWWTTTLAEQFSTGLVLNSVAGTSLQAFNAPAVEYSIPGGSAGTQIQQAAPGNVAVCVTFKTNLRGRSYTGRNYVAGIPLNQVTGNTVNADWCEDLRAGYNLLTDAFGSVLGTWVVVSRYTNKLPRAIGISTPVRSVVMTDNNIDSQRRRLNGRGE